MTQFGARPQAPRFSRRELAEILDLYSRRVALGEWRDYAIDLKEGMAVFSIFRHTHDRPLFTIVKRTIKGDKPDEFALFQGPERLGRGPDLGELLALLEKRPILVKI